MDDGWMVASETWVRGEVEEWAKGRKGRIKLPFKNSIVPICGAFPFLAYNNILCIEVVRLSFAEGPIIAMAFAIICKAEKSMEIYFQEKFTIFKLLNFMA